MAFLSLTAVLLVCTGGRWIAYTEYLIIPCGISNPILTAPNPFWVSVENWGISQIIAATNWFPTLETVHVIAASSGRVDLWVDLRLIGIAATAHPVSVLNRELIRMGLEAHSPRHNNGTGYVHHPRLRASSESGVSDKGHTAGPGRANMAYFHFALNRNREQWNGDTEPPGKRRQQA